MASSWIKVEVITPDKPEIFQIAEILGIDPDAVLGKLVRIWAWADQQTIDGNAGSVTKGVLDRLAFITGFADALISVGWLAYHDGKLILPNFERHNGESSKKRALTNRRVAEHRKRVTQKVTPTALQKELTMFGVSPASMIGGNGTPWLVGTSRIEKYQKTFLRHCRPVLQQMLAVYPRLENYVDERNHVAKAWLHWLGFRLEEAAPYGALGLNFHRFHMERK